MMAVRAFKPPLPELSREAAGVWGNMPRTPLSLLERLRLAPDSVAWGRFVDIYGPLIYGWLRELGLQDHDARDVGQEVLIAVARQMPTFQYQAEKGSFRGWLRVTMLNRLHGFWRDRKSKPAAWGHGQFGQALQDLADSGSHLSRRWDQEHDRHVLKRLLELLECEFEAITWQAFWRVAVNGEQTALVAAALGISTNAVYLAKSRVMRRLREEADGFVDEVRTL